MNKTLILSSLFLLTVILCGCQPSSNDPTPQGNLLEKHAQPAVVHDQELREYLNDKRILRLLNVDEVVIFEAYVDRVVVGDKVSRKQLGEVYYTIQDGWHLKRPNERMEHKPGKGWLIWEQ